MNPSFAYAYTNHTLAFRTFDFKFRVRAFDKPNQLPPADISVYADVRATYGYVFAIVFVFRSRIDCVNSHVI